jgi:hypothetical protein
MKYVGKVIDYCLNDYPVNGGLTLEGIVCHAYDAATGGLTTTRTAASMNSTKELRTARFESRTLTEYREARPDDERHGDRRSAYP